MLKYFYRKTEKLTRAQQSAAVYDLLREKLAEYLKTDSKSIEFVKDSNGCPFIKGNNEIYVSVTHTDCLIACAFSDSRVGIDAERVAARRKSVEKRVYTDGEISLLDLSSDPDLGFFTLWTLKESYLKAIGTGFADNAKSIEFLSLENPVLSNKPDCIFLTENHDNYVISVCENRNIE